MAGLFDEEPIDLRWEASPSGLRLQSGTYLIRARSDEHAVERLVTIVR